MSINTEEIERIKSLQVGKKCYHCKVGYYAYFIKQMNEVRCLNCAKKPFENY